MNIGLMSRRYAKALLKYAQEHKIEEQVFREMMLLERALRDEPLLRKIIDNPILSLKNKRNLLLTVVENYSSAYSRFIDLILRNRRFSSLRTIALTYEEMYRKSKNINSGTLITATIADESLVEKIKSIFSKVSTGQIELETVIDPSIGGGFIFDFDTYRLDASVKTQLNLIKKQFIAENSRRGY